MGRYKGKRLSDEQVIQAFKDELYRIHEGMILNQKGRRVFTYAGNREEHEYVRLYVKGYKRAVAVHRVIWMVVNDSIIPEGWEIHHRDCNPKNNLYENLYCLHPKDHQKLHKSDLMAPVEDESFDPANF